MRIKSRKILLQINRDRQLYVFLLAGMLYLFIFNYLPIYGIQIAFKDYVESKGITGSAWVGLVHFQKFFKSYQFIKLLRNTILLSVYQLAFSFPIPIVLSLLLNQVKGKGFKKVVQTVTYAPHFISLVVMVGMIQVFLSPYNGIVSNIIGFFGGDMKNILGSSDAFRSIYVWSGIWQNTGWATIIYLAALSGINPELYEAARVDGASKFHLLRHIDIPGIMPTAIIMLILSFGRIMSIGFQKAYLLQNKLNLSTSEIIPTYVYKVGLMNAQFEYSTAINLFNSVINIVLLILINKLSKKVTEVGLW